MNLISDVSGNKLRGGFYTPEKIVDFILKWSFNGNNHYDILEPSCGDGIFIKRIIDNNYGYNSITGIEIDENEIQKVKNMKLDRTRMINIDFHKFCNNTDLKYDLIIGNPPYIRYQFFNSKQRDEANTIFKKANIKHSKLSNAWVSFVIGSTLLLKEKGKMAFVLPAELLQVGYAKRLRRYLGRFFNKISIISFQKLVFPSIQQEVILLLCEKVGKEFHNIEHIEVNNITELSNIDIANIKCPQKKIDFKSNKWTFYFLEQSEIDFLNKMMNQRRILPLRSYASVEVGMTTGWNKFFTVPKETIERYDLIEYAYPMAGRSVQVPSTIYTNDDWKCNVENGSRAFFLKFPTRSQLKNRTLEYVEKAEKQGIHDGYKCRIRDEWHIVPSAWISAGLFTRRNNKFPKMILNDVDAYTTDTMHRVQPKEGIEIKSLTASYYNSLTLAFTEICGRSHGGGALELMPNEVEDILFPYNKENKEMIEKIDKMFRDGKDIMDILEYTNNIILIKNYKLTKDEVDIATNIWLKLQKRRINRNSK